MSEDEMRFHETMPFQMAMRTKRYQVIGFIIPAIQTRFDMMNFKT